MSLYTPECDCCRKRPLHLHTGGMQRSSDMRPQPTAGLPTRGTQSLGPSAPLARALSACARPLSQQYRVPSSQSSRSPIPLHPRPSQHPGWGEQLLPGARALGGAWAQLVLQGPCLCGASLRPPSPRQRAAHSH